jgi:hypothetical protein
MVLALVATWVLPQGRFETVQDDKGHTLVVPGTYAPAAETVQLTPIDLFTAVPRALVAAADPEDRRVDLRHGAGAVDDRARLLGRVAKLQALGLATPEAPGRWRLAENLEPRLRALSTRGDIIKTYHHAMARDGRHPTPDRLIIHPEEGVAGVMGRLIERGLRDELAGSAYVLIDGLDGRQHHLAFADLAETTDARPGAVVELRVFVGDGGARRRALVVRSDLDLEAQITARGATWLDRRILERVPETGGAGFAAEVADARVRRVNALLREGLISEREGRLIAPPGLLARLQARDLQAASTQLARETGRPGRPVAVGEAVAGVYQRRLDLASGRFAVLDDGLGFQLAPWRPALEAHRGRAVSGVLEPSGMAWSLGRSRGRAL